MEEIYFNTVQEFNDYYGFETLHPLVNVVRFDKCCLSSGYFGTLVKTETGRTAKDIISDRILTQAKQLLQSETLSVTQISERLGFDYPQHFVRFFKGITGKTPTQWRTA